MCVFSKCNLKKRNAKLPCQFQIQHSTKQRNFITTLTQGRIKCPEVYPDSLRLSNISFQRTVLTSES